MKTASAFITAPEVSVILGVGKAKAYSVIAQINSELNGKGICTVKGRTNRKYFYDRYGLNADDIDTQEVQP